ncbi:MAG: hypothetical protein KBD63_01250 [Bacteriovoracaceae bacterium]|nr:hypothetical protein [Bacteriovoracaceae bacterium]
MIKHVLCLLVLVSSMSLFAQSGTRVSSGGSSVLSSGGGSLSGGGTALGDVGTPLDIESGSGTVNTGSGSVGNIEPPLDIDTGSSVGMIGSQSNLSVDSSYKCHVGVGINTYTGDYQPSTNGGKSPCETYNRIKERHLASPPNQGGGPVGNTGNPSTN